MSVISRWRQLRAVLRLIGKLIRPFLKFIDTENIEHAAYLANGYEATSLPGNLKRERVAEKLAEFLVKKYGEKVPAFIIHALIQLALFAFKREGREESA